MKVQARKDRIEALGAGVVFVAHDPPERLERGFLEGVDRIFPVALDLERRVYRGWGLKRGSVLRVFADPKVWWQYARLILGGGERLRPRGRDALQLGGDFVVGADGRIAYSRPQQRDDRPPVGALLKVLEE